VKTGGYQISFGGSEARKMEFSLVEMVLPKRGREAVCSPPEI